MRVREELWLVGYFVFSIANILKWELSCEKFSPHPQPFSLWRRELIFGRNSVYRSNCLCGLWFFVFGETWWDVRRWNYSPHPQPSTLTSFLGSERELVHKGTRDAIARERGIMRVREELWLVGYFVFSIADILK